MSAESPQTRRPIATGTWLVIGLVGLAVVLAVLANVFRRPPPPMPTTTATTPMQD